MKEVASVLLLLLLLLQIAQATLRGGERALQNATDVCPPCPECSVPTNTTSSSNATVVVQKDPLVLKLLVVDSRGIIDMGTYKKEGKRAVTRGSKHEEYLPAIPSLGSNFFSRLFHFFFRASFFSSLSRLYTTNLTSSKKKNKSRLECPRLHETYPLCCRHSNPNGTHHAPTLCRD